MTARELQGPSEALLARGSQAKLVWFQVVLHTQKYKSWKVVIQLDTEQHVFTWDLCGTDGFGSA